MNPNPDAHFPISRLNNEQLAHAILRSAAIRGEGGFLMTPGGVRPVCMTVSLGIVKLTFSPMPAAAVQPE